MKIFVKVFFFLLILQLVSWEAALCQTYTYNPNKPGCDGTWTNGFCWDKVDVVGCTNNSLSLFPPIISTASFPNFNTYKNNCKVTVNISQSLVLNPGYDFGFYSPVYEINIADGVFLTVDRDLHLMEQSSLTLVNSSGTGDALFTVSGAVYYRKLSSYILRSYVSSEVASIINPGTNTYDGVLFHVLPNAVLRVSHYAGFPNSNTNYFLVEGLFEANQIYLSAGNPGFQDNRLPAKNQLIVRGSSAATANICTGITVEGDAYVIVEAGATLNLPELNLAGTGLFDNYGYTSIENVNFSGSSLFRFFPGSNFVYNNFTKSGSTVLSKCGTTVGSITTPVGSCTATMSRNTDPTHWESLTGDFCFRLLPIYIGDITATAKKESVEVKWETLSETGEEQYELERSLNSNLEWEVIATIPSKGPSQISKWYSYEDLGATMLSPLIYYRIHRKAEETESSKVISVLKPDILEIEEFWLAYPNPFSKSFRLGNKNLKPMDYEKIQISLYNGSDLLGNWESSNLSELNKRLEAFSSNLKDGAYFLKLTKGNQTQVIKLVKQ